MNLSTAQVTFQPISLFKHLAVPVRTLSWSICSNFVAIHPWSVHRSRKSQENTKTICLYLSTTVFTL